MKIEAGKYYRRADGGKAGPAERVDDSKYPFLLLVGDLLYWYSEDGANVSKAPCNRLVAEWTDQPPLNTLIEWDGSDEPPVPEDADVTFWFGCGIVDRMPAGAASGHDVTAYLVHRYPPKEERVKCIRSSVVNTEWGTCIIRDGEVDWSTWEPKP